MAERRIFPAEEKKTNGKTGKRMKEGRNAEKSRRGWGKAVQSFGTGSLH